MREEKEKTKKKSAHPEEGKKIIKEVIKDTGYTKEGKRDK